MNKPFFTSKDFEPKDATEANERRYVVGHANCARAAFLANRKIQPLIQRLEDLEEYLNDTKPFFTAEDFPPDIMSEGHLCDATEFDHARFANAKVAPLIQRLEASIRLNDLEREETAKYKSSNEALIAENERLKLQLISESGAHECRKSKIELLTEQNRELESIVSKRVPKLEKILSIMKEALEYISRATYGTEPCNTDEENNEILATHFFRHQNHAREALQKVKALE